MLVASAPNVIETPAHAPQDNVPQERADASYALRAALAWRLMVPAGPPPLQAGQQPAIAA